ncbi:MAG: cyclopropane-fatty-acyl-phospholipid synthase family protein [Planctomycetaceae bacterium]
MSLEQTSTLSISSSADSPSGSAERIFGHRSSRSRSILIRTLLSRLAGIKTGHLAIVHADTRYSFGDPTSSLQAVVHIHDERLFARSLLGGAVGASESYLQGHWDCDDLTSLFRILLRNEAVLHQLRVSRWSPLGLARKIGHFLNRNSRQGSQKNISAHYDLSNEFFQLFLDPTMLYSSALFTSPEMSLEEASVEKIDRICRKLDLKSNEHIVEIGTGWGAFAIHAATEYGCRVTTTTISKEQHRYAGQKIHELGLQNRIELLLSDYRDLKGQYDKLVSIEMIEAVGREYLPSYFQTCERLVKPGGAMMLQAIVMPEQRFDAYASSVDFIQKYIFPGGFLPSVTEMQKHVSQQTQFRMLDLFDMGFHYAETLRVWNNRFHQRLHEVKQLGFDERFIRMWRYYLTYCEAAFTERATGVAQILWAKPDAKLHAV